MLKLWEMFANEITGKMREVPEHVYDMFKKIKSDYPNLFLKLGLIGDFNLQHESLVAVNRFGSWGSFGMPIFKVTEDLFASLLLTDPKNVSPDEMKFPYRVFLIRIPSGFWELESVTDKKSVPISWVWVHQYKLKDKKFEERTWWRLDAVADDGTCITYFNDKPELSLSTWLKTKDKINSPLYTDMTKSERGVSFAMRRLLVNLCLYISEVKDVKKKKSYKLKGKKRKKRNPEPTTFIVGSDIKIGPDLIGAARDWSRSRQGSSNQWTIKKRFTVRGHWRSQPHGKGKKLRKRIWIEPHWKGPKQGDRLPRVYSAH